MQEKCRDKFETKEANYLSIWEVFGKRVDCRGERDQSSRDKNKVSFPGVYIFV